MITSLLPGREIPGRVELRNHEHIAAFACAVSALCVVAGQYTAVGAHDDGFILLPPREFLGVGWMQTLERNRDACRADFPAADIRGWT